MAWLACAVALGACGANVQAQEARPGEVKKSFAGLSVGWSAAGEVCRNALGSCSDNPLYLGVAYGRQFGSRFALQSFAGIHDGIEERWNSGEGSVTGEVDLTVYGVNAYLLFPLREPFTLMLKGGAHQWTIRTEVARGGSRISEVSEEDSLAFSLGLVSQVSLDERWFLNFALERSWVDSFFLDTLTTFASTVGLRF